MNMDQGHKGICRFYDFAFYVIQHYMDPSYHFDGLWSFGRRICRAVGKLDPRMRFITIDLPAGIKNSLPAIRDGSVFQECSVFQDLLF